MSRSGRRVRDAELSSSDKVLIRQMLLDYQALLQPDADLSVLVQPGATLPVLERCIRAIEIA